MAATDAAPNQFMKEYKWYNSYALANDLQCVVMRAEFSQDLVAQFDIPELLSIDSTVVCSQITMNDPPAKSLYSQADFERNTHHWGNLLCFPIKVRDLSLDTVLTFTLRSHEGKVVAGTSMRMFDANGSLKQGKQKLMLFFNVEGDPNVVIDQNRTPGEYYDHFAKFDHKFGMEKHLESFRSTSSQGANCDWLDKLLLRRINDSLNSNSSFVGLNVDASGESEQKSLMDEWGKPMQELELGRYSFLIVELPIWSQPVLYEEKQYQSVDPHRPPTAQGELLAQCIVEQDDGAIEFSLAGRPFNAAWLSIIADWDMDSENLAEEQNRRLNHNVRRGATDASAKPNKDEKKRIDKILQSVGNQFSIEDMDFLYRFRYSLTENKKALIKFLYTVNWDEEAEVAELPSLLALWKEKAQIDVADALKLLSKEKSFEHQFVREYAVNVLQSASDEELLTFLLQLVQALRYEPVGSSSAPPRLPAQRMEDIQLENSIVGVNHLSIQDAIDKVQQAHRQQQEGEVEGGDAATSSSRSAPTPSRTETLSPLGNFLVDRACASPVIANYLYWYLKVEMDDEMSGPFFHNVFDVFIVQLSTTSPEASLLLKRLMALDNYIHEIFLCQREAIKLGRKKDGKEAALQKLLEAKRLRSLPSIDWVPMPLDPAIKLNGLIPNTAMMFASAVYPCVLEFTEFQEGMVDAGGASVTAPPAPASNRSTHKIIFKSGDDLRQDQLIMQMISLMDRLLKKVNLDLKLLTYGILAVGQQDGIMEFVRNSMPISAVEKKFGTVGEFLKHHNYDKSGPYEVSAQAMDTYIKSCAGCCVMTFILGIGDRHLDNIMITTAGQLFHIDFGFIFGQDPKPMPPPFRFTRSMADAMGGEDSEQYARFKSYCCQSYNWLRKSANLILNLLSLMGDAGINDISKRSDLSKVLLKVEEKFRLDLSDEQAEQYFLGLINESLHSIAPKLMEMAHKFAVSLR